MIEGSSGSTIAAVRQDEHSAIS